MKKNKSQNPNLLFRVENRMDAAMVRVETAAILFKNKRYSAVIYIAGVAVECVLRTFIERDEHKFSDKHDMPRMINKVGDFFLRKKRGIDEKFDIILNYWDNKYRYTDEKKLKTYYYDKGLLKHSDFGKTSILRSFAEDCVSAANEIVSTGFLIYEK